MLVGTGPGSAVAIVKSNCGPPLSLRSMPKTSQTTPNSNGATPGRASRTTFFSTGPPGRIVHQRRHPATRGAICQRMDFLPWRPAVPGADPQALNPGAERAGASVEPMTWLVTGGAGYIGAHVVRALQAGGIGTVVLDDLSSGDTGFVPHDVPLVRGSVLDG